MSQGQRIDTLAQAAKAQLATLVAFDSTSRNSNLPIIDYIEQELKKYGAECKRVPSVDGNKSNLLARIGPAAEGGIILSGHTDVVPVDGQKWDTDPFKLTERDGKLYGRGSADMKSFLAVCLAMAPEFAKLPLQKPIWLAFSYDEEIGCLGAPRLLDYVSKHIPKPAFAVIGEPTEMQVVTAHKGVLSFETTVHGLEWHSSQPQLGVNAVHVACGLVQFLSEMAAEIAASVKRDERFDPPYSTIHVGTISGGTARNIIPRECKFQWEIRPLPGDDATVYLKRFETIARDKERMMKLRYPEAAIKTRGMSRMQGVTLPAGADSARQLVMHAANRNHEQAVSFGTEAGVFNDHGVPAIVCGPGNIEQAHKPNEFINAGQIPACVEFMLRLFADGVK